MKKIYIVGRTGFDQKNCILKSISGGNSSSRDLDLAKGFNSLENTMEYAKKEARKLCSNVACFNGGVGEVNIFEVEMEEENKNE